MSESSAAVHVPIDAELGGAFLANMLAAWIDGDRQSSFSVEAADEYRDQRATAEQDRLCVCAPVDPGAGPSPSGEHGAPVCLEGEGPAIGLERFDGSDSGPGSGQVRSTDNGTGGFQNVGSGSLHGAGGRGFCAGGVEYGALESTLASFAGTVCADRYAGDRRRWLLQPVRFQRRASVGLERDNGSGRTSSVARAPPWWQAQ